MKNILRHAGVYWVAMLIPLALAAAFVFFNSSKPGVVILIVYFLAYRPVLDFVRLRATHKVEGVQFWKMFLPFYRFSLFKFLYWK